MTHAFQIQIGDWSNDGHGRCKTFNFQANKPIGDIKTAYHKAKELLPAEICSESFCNEYEDGKLPYATWVKIREHFPMLDPDGIDVYSLKENSDRCPDAEWMAMYTALFIQKGDPELVITMEKELPVLYTDRFIGYGLFHG